MFVLPHIKKGHKLFFSLVIVVFYFGLRLASVDWSLARKGFFYYSLYGDQTSSNPFLKHELYAKDYPLIREQIHVGVWPTDPLRNNLKTTHEGTILQRKRIPQQRHPSTRNRQDAVKV